MFTDDQLDAAIRADQASGSNPMELHLRIQERRRKLAHLDARAAQPVLGIQSDRAHLDAIVAFLAADVTEGEYSPDGMDSLCLTVQECIASGVFEDVLFALLRVFRKECAWQRHLTPLQKLQAAAGTVTAQGKLV